MKILSITAQKPNSTGSGVFLTEVVAALARMGHEQMTVGGVYPEDRVEMPGGVEFIPVYFGAAETDTAVDIPFPICGMSDEMPYPSTRHCDLTEEMTEAFLGAFRRVIRKAVEEFSPDLILCHHLYLLTALVRREFPERKVYGFCHNTDLRQMKKHGLERDFIREGIRRLDRVFVLRKDQMAEVAEIYGADPEKMCVVGMGYNREIFCRMPGLRDMEEEPSGTGAVSPEEEKLSPKKRIRLIYAGKIAEKKGVMSLLRSLSLIPDAGDRLEAVLAGGAGNEKEYAAIRALAKEAPCPVTFAGRLDQRTLAEEYNRSDIFVLPSFSEGLPLTVIEALACGCRVVVSNLPGVKDWLTESVQGGDIRYVTLPALRNADEPVQKELPAFEKRLAAAIAESMEAARTFPADTGALTWERIALLVLGEVRQQDGGV